MGSPFFEQREPLPLAAAPWGSDENRRRARSKSGADDTEDAFDVALDDPRFHADHTQAERDERFVANPIEQHALARVNSTIDLHDERGGATEEIDNHGTDRMLTTEVDPERAVA